MRRKAWLDKTTNNICIKSSIIVSTYLPSSKLTKHQWWVEYETIFCTSPPKVRVFAVEGRAPPSWTTKESVHYHVFFSIWSTIKDGQNLIWSLICKDMHMASECKFSPKLSWQSHSRSCITIEVVLLKWQSKLKDYEESRIYIINTNITSNNFCCQWLLWTTYDL